MIQGSKIEHDGEDRYITPGMDDTAIAPEDVEADEIRPTDLLVAAGVLRVCPSPVTSNAFSPADLLRACNTADATKACHSVFQPVRMGSSTSAAAP